MPDSSDSDRDDELGLSDDHVPSEDENCVTCVPATDDEDSSEDNKRRPLQSSSLRSSTTRAQLKESIPPFWERFLGSLQRFPISSSVLEFLNKREGLGFGNLGTSLPGYIGWQN
jgi:hypothetical protein